MAHILVIDDDPLIAELVCDIMIRARHACGAVGSTEKAEAAIAAKRPDLILLDQNLPGLCGTQWLRSVRVSERLYNLPVIMLTATTGEEDEASARHAGAQDYVRKPFDPAFLVWRVDRLLAARGERAADGTLLAGRNPGRANSALMRC